MLGLSRIRSRGPLNTTKVEIRDFQDLTGVIKWAFLLYRPGDAHRKGGRRTLELLLSLSLSDRHTSCGVIHGVT